MKRANKKSIVFALSLPPTVHLVTKVTECFHLHSLRWQWLIILRLYSYLLALEFGTRNLFGISDHHVKNHVDVVDASFWCHVRTWYNNTVFFFHIYIFIYNICFAFMACKQIRFLLKSWTTLVLVGKNTDNKSTKANKETKVESVFLSFFCFALFSCCTQTNERNIEDLLPECRALTYISYQHQMSKN